MTTHIIISAAMMYHMAMIDIPQEPHTFISADGREWTVRVETPSYDNWRDYGQFIAGCHTDCSVDTIDFGNERIIAAILQ